MRKLVYYVAATLDGFIAREDGSIDDFPWTEEYIAELVEFAPETIPVHLHQAMGTGFEENRRFDTVLMGRKTYQPALDLGVTSPYPTLRQLVFSRTMSEPPDPQVELVSDGAAASVASLKRQPGMAIWLCGGGQLAARLLAANLIDELIVKLNPVLLASGTPLFQDTGEATELELIDSHRHASGHLRLHYRLRLPDPETA